MCACVIVGSLWGGRPGFPARFSFGSVCLLLCLVLFSLRPCTYSHAHGGVDGRDQHAHAHSSTHTLTQARTHSLKHAHAHSSTHTLTQTRTRSLEHAHTHSLKHAHTHSSTHTLTRARTHSLKHAHAHSTVWVNSGAPIPPARAPPSLCTVVLLVLLVLLMLLVRLAALVPTRQRRAPPPPRRRARPSLRVSGMPPDLLRRRRYFPSAQDRATGSLAPSSRFRAVSSRCTGASRASRVWPQSFRCRRPL